jgi:hypothetical protein
MGGGSAFCLRPEVANRRRCLGLKTLVLLGFRFLVGGDVSGRCLLSAVSFLLLRLAPPRQEGTVKQTDRPE